jgi:hypothetical protein
MYSGHKNVRVRWKSCYSFRLRFSEYQKVFGNNTKLSYFKEHIANIGYSIATIDETFCVLNNENGVYMVTTNKFL